MNRKIIAQRIREAREARGLNQTELAQRLGWKSHASICGLEQGEKDLKMWELLKLSEVLGLSPESFYSDKPILMAQSPSILWRNKSKESDALKVEEQNILQHCEDYRLLERLVALPAMQLRTLPIKEITIEKTNFEWVNRLAEELSRELNLGDYPAEVLVRRLEDDFGVILLCRPLENGAAACYRSKEKIVIVINQNDIPWRRMFSLAHELFHIVTWSEALIQTIHNNETLFKKNEALANAFAAALLMPQQMIERDLAGTKLSYSLIVSMARKYGVSTDALLRRLSYLRYVPAESVDATLKDEDFKALDKSTFKKAFEGIDMYGKRFIHLAYLAFERGKLSKGRLGKILGINLRDIEQHLSTYGLELTHDKEITINTGCS